MPTVLRSTSPTGVHTITLNRPDRLNAVDPALADELPAAIDAAAAEDAIRVVVVTGAGRGFCSGLDLSAPPSLPDATLADRVDSLAWVGRWARSIVNCQKPVIAAVNGPAVGAGLGLALAADIRLMAATARLSTGYVRRALSPDAGVSFFLPRLIGLARATELLFTGRDVDASEAERIGLAAMVIDDENFADHVHEYAERLAAGPPAALALTKRLLRSSLDLPLEAQLEREFSYIKMCLGTSDAAEAIASFAEKRRPEFTGR